MLVILSGRARASLREIAQFIARRDKDRANSFVKELQTTAQELGTRPFTFAVVHRLAATGVRERLFIPAAVDIDRYKIDTSWPVPGSRPGMTERVSFQERWS